MATGGSGGHGGGGHGGNGGNGGRGGYGFGGYYQYPYTYTIPVAQSCTTVYSNQATINTANAQLTACNNIGTCNASTLAQIHTNLANALAVATPVGTTCSSGVYPTLGYGYPQVRIL
jgi:hypothetical protein